MKAVVTGATGFVGKWLVKNLLENDIEIIAVVRNRKKVSSEWETNEKCQIIECELKDLKNLDKSHKLENIDLFFHFAWEGTSGDVRFDEKTQLSNVQYTCDAVNLAKRINCKRFIFAGSIMEYEAINFVGSDDSFPAKGNIYSVAKLTADCMAKIFASNLGLDYINIIISNIYGVGEKSARFVNTMLKRMDNSEKISLSEGKQLYDFIYVEDAVDAIRLAAVNGKTNNNYYIGNSVQHPLREFVIRMNNIVGKNAILDFGAFPSNGNYLSYKEFETTKLENEFGFVPKYSFEEGIEKTLEWIRRES